MAIHVSKSYCRVLFASPGERCVGLGCHLQKAREGSFVIKSNRQAVFSLSSSGPRKGVTPWQQVHQKIVAYPKQRSRANMSQSPLSDACRPSVSKKLPNKARLTCEAVRKPGRPYDRNLAPSGVALLPVVSNPMNPSAPSLATTPTIERTPVKHGASGGSISF